MTQNEGHVPKLPTLAELIKQGNDPAQYQWMQCKEHDRSELAVILEADYHYVYILRKHGEPMRRNNEFIAPLPGEPKMKWPGSRADTIAAESVKDAQADLVADFEPALPRPEDVPEGEAWLVRYKERELVAYKGDRSYEDEPWLVYLSRERCFWRLRDADITLISRLVPEVPS